MNVSILNNSLKYICNNFSNIVSLSQWFYKELRKLNYSDDKLEKLLDDRRFEEAESIVKLIKRKPILNTAIHHALEYGINIDEHLRLLNKVYINSCVYSNRILLCGARYGRIDLVKQTLEQYNHTAPENLYFKYELDKALRYASTYGHIDIIKLLLPLLSSLMNTLTVRCAIIDACEGGYIDIVKLLLQNGIKPGHRSMIAACNENHLEIVKLLLENNIDMSGDNQNEALAAAVKNNNVDIVKALLEHGAPSTNKMIQLAFDNKYFEVIRVLIKQQDRKRLTK